MTRAEAIPALVVALAGAFAAGGCAAHPHVDLGTSLDFKGVFRETVVPATLVKGPKLPRAALYVVVSRVAAEQRLAERRAAAAAGASEEPAAEEIAFDERVVGDELTKLLRESGAFESVVTVGERLERPSVTQASEEACAAGASLLVQATIEQPVLRRTDRSIVLSTLVWLTLCFPNMWIHSHSYELTANVRIRVRDLQPGRPLPERPLPKAEAADELNFFERTSSVWTYLLTNLCPSVLLPVEENKVARHLAALAVRKPAAAFLAHLPADLQGSLYRFTVEASGEGPRIEVAYPPTTGGSVLLLGRGVRYAAVVRAREGSKVREVSVNGVPVFPTSRGPVAWPEVPILDRTDMRSDRRWVVEATDADGRRSRCVVIAERVGQVKPDRPASEQVMKPRGR